MPGFIVVWTGSTDTLPENFTLCDGRGETPDLRGKFIKAAYADSSANPKEAQGYYGGAVSREHIHTTGTTATFSHAHVIWTFLAARHCHPIVAPPSGEESLYRLYFIPNESTSYKVTSDGDHTHTPTGSTDIPEHNHTVAATTITTQFPALYVVAFLYTESVPVVPPGSILMWSGAVSTIPYGWVFCDGTNGTPDLRNYMIKGVPVSGEVLATGGAKQHTHTITSGAHNHDNYTDRTHNAAMPQHVHAAATLTTERYIYNGTHYMDFGSVSFNPLYSPDHPYQAISHDHRIYSAGGHSHSVTMEDYASYPPYYNLAFIMKL